MAHKFLIENLLARSDTWIGNNHSSCKEVVSTGNLILDEFLLGGWPISSLTELIIKKEGLGELSLIMQTVKKYTDRNHLCIWLNPPYEPYPPALANAEVALNNLLIINTSSVKEWLWVAEQSIRDNALLLLWNRNQNINYQMLRKLQLAASETILPVFLFNSPEATRDSSPAFLRIIIDSSQTKTLLLTLKKLRGKAPGQQLIMPSMINISDRIQINKMLVNRNQPTHCDFNFILKKSKSSQEIYN